MSAGANPVSACRPMHGPEPDHHDVAQAVNQSAAMLEQFLIARARAGVSERVLVALLRRYADEIDAYGYIPRSWAAQERPRYRSEGLSQPGRHTE